MYDFYYLLPLFLTAMVMVCFYVTNRNITRAFNDAATPATQGAIGVGLIFNTIMNLWLILLIWMLFIVGDLVVV